MAEQQPTHQPDNPSQWCEHQRDIAPDGATAYIYHQLAELWRKRESGNE